MKYRLNYCHRFYGLILAFFVCSLFFSCENSVDITKVQLIDSYSKAKLFGYTDGKYLLGKTRKQYVTDQDIEDFQNRGLKVKFTDKNVLNWVEVVSPNFMLDGRIKVGDKREKLIEYLGTPLEEKEHVGKQNQKLGNINAIYYDNLIFYTRDDIVSIIIFGNTLHSKAHGNVNSGSKKK